MPGRSAGFVMRTCATIKSAVRRAPATMSKTSIAILRLLGAFTVEVNAACSVSVAVRSKKARALLACLAMKPDGRASREELATLLWGDTRDGQARHSLRQCLVWLRQDTHHL